MIKTILNTVIGNLNWVKISIIASVLLFIGGVIYSGYSYVDNLATENTELTDKNARLEESNRTLEQAIKDQQAAIDALNRDIQLMNEVQTQTLKDFAASRNRVSILENKLRDHELGFLASQKPALVENIINSATADIGRCFEIATGSPLTSSEINATLKSEINSECFDIANPNYQPND